MNSTSKKKFLFSNLYRQNKPLNKQYPDRYFQTNSNLNFDPNKNHQSKQSFIDKISQNSSFKFEQNQLSQLEMDSSCNDKYPFFEISNKRKMQELPNPQIYLLMSKHVNTFENKIVKSQKRNKKIIENLQSESIKKRPNSTREFQKAPKITQFCRQTFYRNSLASKRLNWPKKQFEDILHSNINLDINTKKVGISKKTRPYLSNRSFVTYEIYKLKERIGIDVEILGGAFQQIKFRLIMNQADSKTFSNHWPHKIDQFIDKCLVVTPQGISLKLSSFYQQNNKFRSAQAKSIKRISFEHQFFLAKRTSSKKITTKIDNFQNHKSSLPDSHQDQFQNQQIEIEVIKQHQVKIKDCNIDIEQKQQLFSSINIENEEDDLSKSMQRFKSQASTPKRLIIEETDNANQAKEDQPSKGFKF